MTQVTMQPPTDDAVDTTDPLRTVEFVLPMPGLGPATSFALVSLDDDGRLYSLRSVQDPGLRLLVVSPQSFFPGYAPELDDETCAALELTDAADAALLVVVNPGESASSATANLLAPVVVNVRTRRAMQTLLVGTDEPLRAPLLATG